VAGYLGADGNFEAARGHCRTGTRAGFVLTRPAFPGCVSQGCTRPQALKNIREAIEVYIEALLEEGLPVLAEIGREVVEF
jgi:predicted RNase H-like HicB family nuclease